MVPSTSHTKHIHLQAAVPKIPPHATTADVPFPLRLSTYHVMTVIFTSNTVVAGWR
jgi:hypothetical protein